MPSGRAVSSFEEQANNDVGYRQSRRVTPVAPLRGQPSRRAVFGSHLRIHLSRSSPAHPCACPLLFGTGVLHPRCSSQRWRRRLKAHGRVGCRSGRRSRAPCRATPRELGEIRAERAHGSAPGRLRRAWARGKPQQAASRHAAADEDKTAAKRKSPSGALEPLTRSRAWSKVRPKEKIPARRSASSFYHSQVQAAPRKITFLATTARQVFRSSRMGQ